MTKLGISVGILATVFCFSVGAQTINVMVLDQAGAQAVLRGRARNSGTRPRQSQWWILPAICLPSSGWMVSALQARILPSRRDRKSTRLNSSHQIISYAVFCLKKKKSETQNTSPASYKHARM